MDGAAPADGGVAPGVRDRPELGGDDHDATWTSLGLYESLCPHRLAPGIADPPTRVSHKRGGAPGPLHDFDTAHIDPDKWFGVEPGGLSTEAIRQLQDNRLSLVYRSYGKTDSDSELLGNGHQLFFPKPASITAIQATV